MTSDCKDENLEFFQNITKLVDQAFNNLDNGDHLNFRSSMNELCIESIKHYTKLYGKSATLHFIEQVEKD